MTTSLPTDLLKALTTNQNLSRTRLLQEAVSFKPTRHRVRTASGSTLYTHCTLDTLLLPLVLEEDVEVETVPPGEAQPLVFNVKSGQVTGSEGVLISVPVRVDSGPVQQSFCPYSNAFPDRAAYEAWAAQSPVPTVGVSLSEAQQLAETLVAQLDAEDANAPLGCC
ncbi:organomercurial lyase [Deinococcus sp. YIM 77859]|uniref:organomercurial lyase n=1 Tax=Deinococcus sp. YIM 77859 TaxID=1540221 RepID=UPI00055623A1|nr:organomercurial lyase [Deinococcus sp. YIM 77859]